MQTKYIAILSLAVASVAFLSADVLVTRTPELLGDAPAVLYRVGDRMFGLAWNDYAGYFLNGVMFDDRTQCQLSQVWGGDVDNYDADGNSIHQEINCLMVWREGKFRGWIDFRNVGRHRPFCGAESVERLPDVCMWR